MQWASRLLAGTLFVATDRGQFVRPTWRARNRFTIDGQPTFLLGISLLRRARCDE